MAGSTVKGNIRWAGVLLFSLLACEAAEVPLLAPGLEQRPAEPPPLTLAQAPIWMGGEAAPLPCLPMGHPDGPVAQGVSRMDPTATGTPDAGTCQVAVADPLAGTSGGPDEVPTVIARSTPPAAPTLVSPNSQVASLRPTFTWNALSDATWYKVFIRDGATATGTPRVDRWVTAAEVGCGAGTGTCSWSADLDMAEGSGIWWIYGWNSFGPGPWSAGMAFSVLLTASPPPAPTQIGPNSEVATDRPTFTWNAVSDATWYKVFVRDSGTQTGAARINLWVTATTAGCAAGTGTCSWTASTDLSVGTAQWWVQAWRDGAGAGSWSPTMAFSVSSAPSPPAAPTLVSPNSEVTSQRPIFTWNAVTGSTWYKIFIRDAATATGAPLVDRWVTAAEVGCESQTGTCSWTADLDLANGAGTWWAQGWGPDGAGAGAWSVGMSFSVNAPSVPPAAGLIAPSGTAENLRPDFQWNAVSSATHYLVYIRDASTPGGALIEQEFTAAAVNCGAGTGTCTYTPGVNLALGAGVWWIQTRNAVGSGPWSASMNFTIAEPPNSAPNTPSITSVTNIGQESATLNGSAFSDPDDGDTLQGSEWQADEEGGDFSSPVALTSDSGADPTNSSVSGLSPGTNHVARVRYQDNHGAWSAWSAPEGFTTAPSTPPTTPTVTSVTDIGQESATLNGSAFADPDLGDTHGTSEWQVDVAAGDFSSPVATSGETDTHRTSWMVEGLFPDTGYQGRVRYRDHHGIWSDWSAGEPFTTLPPSDPPNTPSMNAATGITSTSATLSASAFSDPNGGDTHAASHWQVDLLGNAFVSPVVDSEQVGVNLTSFGVSGLTPGTLYQARVRYRDNVGAWSDWSAAVNFELPPSVASLFDFRFDSYSTTNDIHTNPDGLGMSTNHETDVSLDMAQAPPGGPRQSMLYTYPDRTGDAGRCTDRTIRTRAELPGGVTEMWVELVVKFEDGFTTVAPLSWGCSSAPELKLLFFNHSGAGSGGIASGRHGMHVGTWGNNRVFLGTPNDHAEFDTFDKSLFDGEWHTFRLHVVLPTVPNSSSSVEDGSGDGRFRMWWNGSLDIDLQNISTSAAQFSELWFGINMNQGQGEPQHLWWNRIVVWTNDPGW